MSEQNVSPGTNIGEYNVVRIISKGEFGTLYECKRGRTAVTVRGKKQGEQWAVDSEVGMMTGLPPHTNVATFLDSVSHGNTIYFVLENCNIGTLNDFVIKERPRELFLQSLMFDMAKGLYHLHRNKLVHRDLNPDNILVSAGSSRPICKLSNMALAQYCNCYNAFDSVANVLDISTHEDIYVFLTTRCLSKYWPPEIKEPGQSFRFASDIYSMGLVFLSLLAMNVKHDKFLTKDVIYPPTIKTSGVCSELPLYLCSDIDTKEIVYRLVKSEPLQTLIWGMLHPLHSKRLQAGPVVSSLETFVPPDRSIPIGSIVLISLTVLFLVVLVTWKLTFQ